jgi:hypothetical protein
MLQAAEPTIEEIIAQLDAAKSDQNAAKAKADEAAAEAKKQADEVAAAEKKKQDAYTTKPVIEGVVSLDD